MRNNQPKFVGFDNILPLAAGATGVLTLTAPICFTAKYLVVLPIDAGNISLCTISQLRWNNHDLIAGGVIPSTALSATGFTPNGAQGTLTEFTLPVETADTFAIVVTNGTPNPIDVLAYWVTDYGAQ